MEVCLSLAGRLAKPAGHRAAIQFYKSWRFFEFARIQRETHSRAFGQYPFDIPDHKILINDMISGFDNAAEFVGMRRSEFAGEMSGVVRGARGCNKISPAPKSAATEYGRRVRTCRIILALSRKHSRFGTSAQ
jgi:hypothetical protein